MTNKTATKSLPKAGKAKNGCKVGWGHPHLAKLQKQGSKTRITMYVDDNVLVAFRTQAETQGIGYQTITNQVLLDYLHQDESVLESLLRKIIREEMQTTQKGLEI